MESITPITEYRRLEFASPEAAIAASKLLASLTVAGKRVELLTGPGRLVVWAATLSYDERVLYLSPGAYEQLRMAASSLPTPLAVSDDALPRTRALLLGDANDWNGGATPDPLPRHVLRRSSERPPSGTTVPTTDPRHAH